MKPSVALLLLPTPLLPVPPLPQGEAGIPRWSLAELDLHVSPIPELGQLGIEGALVLRLEGAPSPGPDLRLGDQVRFRDVRPEGGASVSLNEPPAAGGRGVEARIRADEPFAPGSELEVAFFCETVGAGNQIVVEPAYALASWVEGWYPFPYDAERSFSRQMAAPGSTTFHLPEGWDAVSNGVRASRVVDGASTDLTFTVDVPVARSFAAAPYRSVVHPVGERQIGVYLLPGNTIDAERQAELLAAALAAEEQRFGPYPYASYAIAEVPEKHQGFYASSEQGFIMARSSAFRWEHGNLPLWGHEMAHGWWGNQVGTTGPGAILCSESLAQYGAVVAIETLEGREAATEFLRFSRTGYSPLQCARGYFGMARQGRDEALSRLESGGWHHDLSDAKGHWVYHMLRRRIGDERFFGGLRDLIGRFSGKRMALDDLRACFVALAPEEDLETFFAQWLDRPGAPVIDASWEEPSGGTTALTLEQVQEGEPYAIELTLVVEGEEGTWEGDVSLTRRTLRLEVEGVGAITHVELDPDHELLLWCEEYGERP